MTYAQVMSIFHVVWLYWCRLAQLFLFRTFLIWPRTVSGSFISTYESAAVSSCYYNSVTGSVFTSLLPALQYIVSNLLFMTVVYSLLRTNDYFPLAFHPFNQAILSFSPRRHPKIPKATPSHTRALSAHLITFIINNYASIRYAHSISISLIVAISIQYLLIILLSCICSIKLCTCLNTLWDVLSLRGILCACSVNGIS